MQTGEGRWSAPEIARSGFRFTLERPRLVAVWALISFIYNLAGSMFAAATAGPSINRLLDLVLRPNPDPNAAAPLLGQIAPIYAALLALGLAANAVFLATANRAVAPLALGSRARAGLGRDVLRQFALLLVLTPLAIAGGFVLPLVSLLLSNIMSPAMADVVGATVSLTGLGYLWLRLSLASPAAYALGRIDLASVWASTRGRLWSLVRVYALAIVLSGLVYLLGLITIEKGLSAAFGGEAKFDSLTQFDFSSPAALLTPARLALTALQSILSALVLPVLLCPPIEIYRALETAKSSPESPIGGDGPWG